MMKYAVWIMRGMVVLVIVLSAELIAGTVERKPQYIGIPYAVLSAVIWNLPLLLSTIEIRSKVRRYLLTLIILPIGTITSIVMLGYNMFVFGFVVSVHLFLIFRILIREKNERPAI